MTTYVGSVGAMAPVGCMSSLAIDEEARTVLGGGPGTLAPVRARVVDAPSRAWQVAKSGHIGNDAALASLARRQSRAGGSLRFIPCDAVEHNMLTPRGSEDLAGWSGLVEHAAAPVAGVYMLDAWPAILGRVTAGTVATTPRVPVVRQGVAYLAVHTTGLPLLRVVTRDADGVQVQAVDAQMIRTIEETTVITTSTVIIDGVGEVPVGAVLFRSAKIAVTVDPMYEATVELQVLPAAADPDVWVSWPSAAYSQTPYTAGRAADEVLVVPGGRAPAWTWGNGFEESSYRVVEAGR